MTTKVNGFAHPGQHLTGGLPMYTITTALDIVTVTNNDNANLDTLIAAISTRAAPVIMGTPAGTGPYTLRIAVEHNDIFGDLTAFANELKAITGDATLTVVAYTF